MREKLEKWADFSENNDGKGAYNLIIGEGYRSTVDFPASALSMDMYQFCRSKVILGYFLS